MTQVDFYNKEQVDDLLAAKADDSEVDNIAADVGTSADEPSASGSIWARVKYILTHWMTTDSAQTVSAKKTFSVSPEVPTTPATPESAINSVYANDATEGVNNIAHKSGNETWYNEKTLNGALRIIGSANVNRCILKTTPLVYDAENPPATIQYFHFLVFMDANNTECGGFWTRVNTDGSTSVGVVTRDSNGVRKVTEIVKGGVIL